jgi:hypothetical protein
MNIKNKYSKVRNGSLAVFGVTLLFLSMLSMVQPPSGNATLIDDWLISLKSSMQPLKNPM